MKNILLAAVSAALLTLGSSPAQAQQIEIELKIKAKVDAGAAKKVLGTIGAAIGNVEPEKLSKMIDKLSQGRVQIDPALFKLLQDKIAQKKMADLGKIDADALFKKLDKDGDGKLTKKEFLQIAEEFKDKIGENNMELARLLLGKRYDELDPTGMGLTREQFRQEVARFQKEQAGK